MNQINSVKSFIKFWQDQYGRADPRTALDQYYWSSRVKESIYYSDLEEWCNQNIGDEHWHRMYNKFWFTSESEYVMFNIAWNGEK